MSKGFKWLAASAACAFAAAPVLADHSWRNYHWPLAKPVPAGGETFEVLTRLTQNYWDAIIPKAVADWDNDGGTPYTDYLNPTLAGEAPGDAKKCDPIRSKVVVCSASYGFRGWLGVATVWLDGAHIVQATTKLNESYLNSGTYGTDAWRATVACQEIGHDFGLGHQDEDFYNADKVDGNGKQSCMDYTDDPEGNEEPNQHDYEQLKTIYDAHIAEETDSSGGEDDGGGGGGPPPGKGPNRLDPLEFRTVGELPSADAVVSRDWGTAIGFDAHGRPNVFRMDLRGGRAKVTHVTWVPGFRPAQHHMRGD